MKLLRVYLDTSVVGGCFDDEFAPWSNGLMEDFHAGRLLSVVSELLATELESAPEAVRAKFEEILELGPEFLEVSEEALALTAAYAEHGALPPQRYAPQRISNGC